MNLISNAIKFTSTGYVSILLSVSNLSKPPSSPTPYSRCLEIIVEDTGVGMTNYEASQLFKTRFYQAKSQVHKQGSSGLGLNISYKLVELMKGSLEVESLKGKGSKFIVKIPCLSVDEGEKNQFIQSLNPAQISSKYENSQMNILVVDDNEINRKILMTMLSKEGYKCETANDGEEALSKFLKSTLIPYDLILMDIEMPKMDGHEVTRRIREYERDQKKEQRIPIICVSGNTGEEFKNKVMREGFDECVSKPYDKLNMLQKIHDLLNLSSNIFIPPNLKRKLEITESETLPTKKPNNTN